MEKVFQLLLRLIEKVPWASEWEKTGAHQALADAWEDVAKHLHIDTAAEDYVAPIAPPPQEAPAAAPPATLAGTSDVIAVAAEVIKQLRALGVVPAPEAAAAPLPADSLKETAAADTAAAPAADTAAAPAADTAAAPAAPQQ